MASETTNELAKHAADSFGKTVDGLVMEKALQAALPMLKSSLSGITYNGDNQQVAALPVGEKSQETTRSV